MSNDKYMGIDATTGNPEYRKLIADKVKNLMNGQSSISAQELDSIFGGLSEEGRSRLNSIASMDGNPSIFNSEELKVLYTLADAKLQIGEDGKEHFYFDGVTDNTKNSGLEEAYSHEVSTVIKNMVEDKNVSDKYLATFKKFNNVDVEKLSKGLTLKQQLTSDDENVALNAANQEFTTRYIDKNTGKNMTVPEIVAKFSLFEKVSDRDRVGYDDLCSKFKDETGVEITDMERYRDGGTTTYNIDDYRVYLPSPLKKANDRITNTKTGAVLHGEEDYLEPKSSKTIPYARGECFLVVGYENPNEGIKVKFHRNKNVDTLQPSGATITTSDGKTVEKQYKLSDTIDPKIYNFCER